MKQEQEIAEGKSNRLLLVDGMELPADEVVCATGYQNMRTQARSIFGCRDKLADQAERVWGFEQEGELRTIWRKTGHSGFWFMGEKLALARYHSRMPALRIKALEQGLCKYEDQ